MEIVFVSLWTLTTLVVTAARVWWLWPDWQAKLIAVARIREARRSSSLTEIGASSSDDGSL